MAPSSKFRIGPWSTSNYVIFDNCEGLLGLTWQLAMNTWHESESFRKILVFAGLISSSSFKNATIVVDGTGLVPSKRCQFKSFGFEGLFFWILQNCTVDGFFKTKNRSLSVDRFRFLNSFPYRFAVTGSWRRSKIKACCWRTNLLQFAVATTTPKLVVIIFWILIYFHWFTFMWIVLFSLPRSTLESGQSDYHLPRRHLGKLFEPPLLCYLCTSWCANSFDVISAIFFVSLSSSTN